MQKLVTLETTAEARKQIVDSGKWIVGGFVAPMTILGITTYADLKTRIEKAADKVVKDVAEQVKEVTDLALASVREDIEETRATLMAEFQV